MNYDTPCKNNQYFAAANSYQGFVSKFDSVFSPEKFDRIFIIKGGPGTGKSSLMRKVLSFATEKNCLCDEIYCSSDTNSLDGIIIRKNGHSYALLDGTSPHAKDPTFPGAKEEIVNTAKGISNDKISPYFNKLEELNNDKKMHYANAYKYLSVAGNVSTQIDDIIQKNTSYSKAESCVDRLLEEITITKTEEKCEYLYKSSFSKNGYSTFGFTNKKPFLDISMTQTDKNIFMKILLQKLLNLHTVKTVFYSPFTHNKVEYIETSDFFIGSNTDIKSEFSYSSTHEELIKCKNILLNLAKRELNEASISHFEMEKIYSSSIDFSVNDELCSYVCETILKSID